MADFNLQNILKKFGIDINKKPGNINIPKPSDDIPEVGLVYSINTPRTDGFEKKPPKMQAIYAVKLPPEGSKAEKPSVHAVYAVYAPPKGKKSGGKKINLTEAVQNSAKNVGKAVKNAASKIANFFKK